MLTLRQKRVMYTAGNAIFIKDGCQFFKLIKEHELLLLSGRKQNRGKSVLHNQKINQMEMIFVSTVL